jgi:hypothetical protein
LKRSRLFLPVAAGAAGAAAFAAVGLAGPPGTSGFTSVPSANPKIAGVVEPNILPPQLAATIVAQGAMKLENGTAQVPYYGYDGDGPMVAPPGAVQTPGHNIEATKTEPDKNTYLVLKGQHGADPGYRYGTHFLFQGHEGGAPGYITRVNLDADGPHRVTLLATQDVNGADLPTFDGSTLDPWAQRLLFTAEKGNAGGVWQATLSVPSRVEDISGVLGRGGYEAIQNDSEGNLYIVEDVGGRAGVQNPNAKQPNSFIYRFLPKDKSHLTAGGKLQVLQVMSLANPGEPIVFHPGEPDRDILSQDERDLHTYGNVFTTRWITIHDSDIDGTTPYDANALAKTAGATPFKRPENGQFRPDSNFTQFYFDETGDTNANTEAQSAYGGFGGIMKLTQSPSSDAGQLTLFYLSDVAHTAFDNVAFLSAKKVVFVEDAGDLLHTQRNALDSAYVFDVTTNYGAPGAPAPVRLLAEGRDPSATFDSPLADDRSNNGFQNDGDNEITGFHVSDGDPTPGGILGAKTPKALEDAATNGGAEPGSWRVFYTQQHGDNVTWEIVRGS